MNEPLIALLGVLLSALISWLISIQRFNIEMKKHRSDIQEMYIDKLVEKRMQYYPHLYEKISILIKNVRDKTVSINELKEFQKEIREWDSSYSVYFSIGTAYRFHNFYMDLTKKCNMNDTEFRKFTSTEKEYINFRKNLSGLELALKTDLGILPVDFAEIGKKFKTFEEYIDNLIMLERKKIE